MLIKWQKMFRKRCNLLLSNNTNITPNHNMCRTSVLVTSPATFFYHVSAEKLVKMETFAMESYFPSKHLVMFTWFPCNESVNLRSIFENEFLYALTDLQYIVLNDIQIGEHNHFTKLPV